MAVRDFSKAAGNQWFIATFVAEEGLDAVSGTGWSWLAEKGSAPTCFDFRESSAGRSNSPVCNASRLD